MAMPRRSGGSRRMSRPLTVIEPERAAVNPDRVRSKRRLAASRRAEQGDETAGRNGQVDALEHVWVP